MTWKRAAYWIHLIGGTLAVQVSLVLICVDAELAKRATVVISTAGSLGYFAMFRLIMTQKDYE